MSKVRFHPIVEYFRGALGGLVFRLSHNGKTSVYMSPDMSRVKWSPAQVAHREHFAEAVAYARAAIAKPEIRLIYEQMSLEQKGNKRPFDVAASHYMKGNNLLGSDFRWNVESWRAAQKYKKRKKRY